MLPQSDYKCATSNAFTCEMNKPFVITFFVHCALSENYKRCVSKASSTIATRYRVNYSCLPFTSSF